MEDNESNSGIDSYGNKVWYNSNKKLHRIDGPAVEYRGGTECWYINGILHRIDGPAIEFSDGYKSWCLNRTKYSEEEFNEAVRFPDLAIPYLVKKNDIYFIKFREEVGIRISYLAEVYVNGCYIRLNEEIKELLLQFVRGLERFEPLLDWIQENSNYFPSEFVERLYY
jgi:hypothetical protein